MKNDRPRPLNPDPIVQSNYRIEDLVFQTRELVVYRAQHRDGTPHALIRLNFSAEICENLQKQDRFQKGLDQLLILRHPSLRPVVDGGLDSIDAHPWLATQWFEGPLLSELEMTQADLDHLRAQAEDLINALGYRAGALCFTPTEIVTTTASDGQALHTFAIDYFSWFRDWAIGYPPGEKNNPHQALDQLLQSLPPSQPAPAPSLLLAPPSSQPATPESSPAPLSLPIPKSSPLKALALIGSLLLLIGGGIWWINQQAPASPPPETALAAIPPKENKPSPPKITPDLPKTEEPKTSPLPEPTPKTTSTSRPEFAGEIIDVEADQENDLRENVGHWIVLNGEVSKISDETLSFKNSSLQAKLPANTPAIEVGQVLNLTGLLKSVSLLEVELPDDIIINQAFKDNYTLEDEEQLRGMNRSIVSVQGSVADFTRTENSLYLVFHEKGPGFRAVVRAKKAEDGLDEDYLRTFIGKEINVTGEISIFENASGGKGKRLLIEFTKKSDLELIEK
ncbi:hypothetical protein V2O64_13645 [Verrucomicrobiaceae bacterium 227]